MKKSLIYILLAGSLASCGTQKAVSGTTTSTTASTKTINKNSEFFSVIEKPASFDALKITSKIDIQNGKFIPTLTGTFYIENNQKVWSNITAFGGLFGGARGIATPSGIKAYEKINRTYIDSDFTYLNRLLGVNFINYNALQNLLIGRTFVPVNESDFSLTKSDNGYKLTSNKAQEVVVDGKKSAYNVSLSYDTQFNLSNVVVNDANSDNQLEINYSNWMTSNNLSLPKNVKIIIKNKKTDQILIENTNFDFSRMDTPYSVPSNYTKTEIK